MAICKLILIIDDEHAIRQTLSMVFERAGYAVLVAGNGREGLSLFRLNPVDVVVLDYHLPGPGFDGQNVGTEMKKSKPKVPIIVFSGDVGAGSATSFADLLLPKPNEPRELLRQTAELLERGVSR